MRATERDSLYRNIERMSILEVLTAINAEDQKVAPAVALAIPAIERLCIAVSDRMLAGGRLFYIGAGTSGRLGIVDASECPPTFGVPHDLVIGLIAGGDTAIRKAVEFAEDDFEKGWLDLCNAGITASDTVIGIAASGTTPYVVGAVQKARESGVLTSCITCSPGSVLGEAVELPIEISVGPEFITGSTRMKSGTAQKLVLNMISTSLMIQLGRVEDNKMVDMQLSNDKLIERGVRMIMQVCEIDAVAAKSLLLEFGSVRKAIGSVKKVD